MHMAVWMMRRLQHERRLYWAAEWLFSVLSAQSACTSDWIYTQVTWLEKILAPLANLEAGMDHLQTNA